MSANAQAGKPVNGSSPGLVLPRETRTTWPAFTWCANSFASCGFVTGGVAADEDSGPLGELEGDPPFRGGGGSPGRPGFVVVSVVVVVVVVVVVDVVEVSLVVVVSTASQWSSLPRAAP